MRKLNLLSILAFVALVILPACQQLEPDVFDKPSSTRLSEFLEEIRTTLSSEQYGWTLDYYPGSKYSSVTYALSFTDQKVTACVEKKPTETETSTYALKTDDGPVLSFDTYNKILHAYATPDSKKYQAKGGDFEFEIRAFDKENKVITLIGKRSRNTCTLRPLTKPAEEYFAGVKSFERSITVPAAAATIDGKEIELYIDNGIRSITIGEKDAPKDSLQTVRYVLTENTFRFSKPFKVGDVEFSEWTYDPANETLNGSGITFVKFIPAGYITYEQYLGKYTFYYYNASRSFPVQLVEEEAGLSFRMVGFSTYFEPILTFNGGRGRLDWVKQTIGGSGSLEYILAPWDTNAGYLTWMDEVGLVGSVEDNTVEDFVVTFADNGVWEDHKASGWLVWSMNGDSSAGAVSSWTTATGSYQVPGDLSMQKIKE
ncbi:MAG: DUF4302 domain-containing protein [Bacteroidales bacterium]|nr:DUF4302 domain-containing protein [Bacteroidales bacterium]